MPLKNKKKKNKTSPEQTQTNHIFLKRTKRMMITEIMLGFSKTRLTVNLVGNTFNTRDDKNNLPHCQPTYFC